ncbi:MAG: hypothetical protein ACFFCZ_29245 [Promethearchaeota archaeon]
MSDFDDKDVHPIIEEVLNLAKKKGTSDTEDWISTIIFDEEAIEKLKKLLASYFNSKDLPNVVKELLTLAYFFDQKNAKQASDALMEVINTSVGVLAALIHQTTDNTDEQSINIPEKRPGDTEEKSRTHRQPS